MKFGARILKTGVAVTLALYIALFFELEPVIYAALAAFLSVQPTLYRSWQNFSDQVQANVLGASLAVSATYLLGNDPFIVGLVIMLVITIHLKWHSEKSLPLSIITVIAIMESTTGHFFLFALERFLIILIGIGSSVLVNIIFLPPKYKDRLYTKLQNTNLDILSYLRSLVFAPAEEQVRYEEDIERLQDELIDIDQTYLLYKEERTYFRKMKYTKARKLVLFREMIRLSHTSLYLVRSLDQHRAQLQDTPEEFNELLRREIELFTHYHERILLKYEGKLITHQPHHASDDVLHGRDAVLQSFMNMYQKKREEDNQDQWVHLFPLFATVVDYANHLEHLDKLVEGYLSSHEEKEA